MEVIRVALAESSVAALSTRQHRAVSLDHKRAVLTAYDLPPQNIISEFRLPFYAFSLMHHVLTSSL